MKLLLTDLQDKVNPLLADADALLTRLEETRRDIAIDRRLAIEEEDYVRSEVPNEEEYAYMATRLETLKSHLTYFRNAVQEDIDKCAGVVK